MTQVERPKEAAHLGRRRDPGRVGIGDDSSGGLWLVYNVREWAGEVHERLIGTAHDSSAAGELLERPGTDGPRPVPFDERIRDDHGRPTIKRGEIAPSDPTIDALAQPTGHVVPAVRGIGIKTEIQTMISSGHEHRLDESAHAGRSTRIEPADEQGMVVALRRCTERIEPGELDPARPTAGTARPLGRAQHQIEARLERDETHLICRPDVPDQDGRSSQRVSLPDQLEEQRCSFDRGSVCRESPWMRPTERRRLNEHAFHTWDIAVALDPAAVLPADAADLVIDNLDLVTRFTARPTGDTPPMA